MLKTEADVERVIFHEAYGHYDIQIFEGHALINPKM